MATLVSDKIKLTNHWLRSDNEKIIDAKDIDWTGYTLGSQNIHHSSELISYINSIGAFKLNGSYVNNNDDLKVIQNISFNNNNFTLSYTYIMRPGKIVNNGGEIFNDYHNNQASGQNSHAEGCYNNSFGEASHTSGMYNSAYSTAEAAFGKFNLSSNNTYIFTVGVGTSTSNRKNALTISNNGNVNIGNLKVSNLTFSNIHGEIPLTKNIITLTYSDLTMLIENAELLPGCLYKIPNYQTIITTTTDQCYSDGQELTLIVMAISEDCLSPNGYIIDYEGSIYEVKYSVDNDPNRFAFASEDGKGTIYWMKDTNNNEAPFDFISIIWNIDTDYYSVHGVYTFGSSSNDSKNMYNNIIEYGCYNINIDSSINCKIGANSSNVVIVSSNNIIIGDNCEQVSINSSSYIEYEHNIKNAAVNSMMNTHLCSGKYTTGMQSFDSSIDYQTVIKPKNSVEIYV